MREVTFIQENSQKWREFEKSYKKNRDTEFLLKNYSELVDDLAYASTYYPDSPTTLYLNQLLIKCNSKIQNYKSHEKSSIKDFFLNVQPGIVSKHYKKFLLALIVTVIGIVIGAVSAANDDTFLKLIFGERYLKMTLENIKNNDPMRVYKDMAQFQMFAAITLNNIRVAFFAFTLGIFFSYGTAVVLLQNGIMLGAFHYLFYKHGLLGQSLLTVWIHGSLEIPAIIISGAAGIIIGNSFLFPGTYSRIVSLRRGAMSGINIILGVIPLFIVAGFYEGFVTRHTEMPLPVNLFIIFLSLLFIFVYYVIYPIFKKGKENEI